MKASISRRLSIFAGVSGETVRQLLVPSTLLTLGPTLIATVIVWSVIGWLAKVLAVPGAVTICLESLVTAPVVAQCALGSREGNLAAGLLTPLADGSDGRSAFVVRYAAFLTAWILPWHTVGQWLFARTVAHVSGGMGLMLVSGGWATGSPASERAIGKAALLVSLLVIVSLLGIVVVPLGTVVATRTATVRELFSRGPWLWLLRERSSDLSALFSALFGGFALFSAIAVPLLLLVTTVTSYISIDTGLFFARLMYLVPAALVPILLGRMAGAFIAAEEVFGDIDPMGDGAGVVATKIEGSSGVHATKPLRSPARLDSAALVKLTAEIATKADVQLVEALDEAEKLARANPEHPVVLALLARLYLRIGRTSDGYRAAEQTIGFALRAGTPPVALELLSELPDRDTLRLTADTWVTFGRVLLTRERLDDALWAFGRAKFAAEQSPTAGPMSPVEKSHIEKAIIAVAEAATRANKTHDAIAIYERFLVEHPSSAFLPYCQAELTRLRALTK